MKVFLFSLLFTFSVLAADIVGFWKTIDDATKKAQSVVAVYPYKGKYYGRIVATYDEHTGELKDTIYTPDERAPGVVGDPHYAGLDLIYNLVPKDHKFVGNIIDSNDINDGERGNEQRACGCFRFHFSSLKPKSDRGK